MFTQEQLDALQEIINIAMGQGADRLARLIETFVVLSVPRLYAVKGSDDMHEAHQQISKQPVITTRQSFIGPFRGEVLVIFGMNGANELAELMGYVDDGEAQIKEELILDLTNLLVGACISGICEQLHLEQSTFSSPTLFFEGETLNSFIQGTALKDSKALLVEIQFRIESHAFACELLICISNTSIKAVSDAVDRLIDSV
ncbi:chemotaxis protein CheC [Hahella sp. CCB-MM4]|uniref:chemotaxis protein CheC n=1 Tax=Hahella sp. (strain CCB-MM4) TaxID=1926491 RepID=UPI000B9B6291|nr:chemotaxis protein CheC [Hahella sp. CCB-MM4]OZG71141.1 chemotaxis protein CheC [Hahella sp. CCB-MM4]